MEEEIIFTAYVVTCETAGCGNSMIAIEIEAPVENPNFICGVCNQQIANFVLASEWVPPVIEEPIVSEEPVFTETIIEDGAF